MRARSPSDTAILIARSILLSAHDPHLSALLAPGEEHSTRRMLGERADGGWFGFAERHPRTRRLLMLAERILLGGIFAHYLARKRWIAGEVRRAMETGVRQIVILEFPQVSFFEIDHPATQRSKRESLAPAENLHFLPAELCSELPHEVAASCASFSCGEPSVVIAEGLTMYFHGGRVKELLRSSARLAGSEGRVIFSFMEAADDGSISFRGANPAVGCWLHLRREPFHWGCRRKDLPEFLRTAGLRLQAIANHRDLRAKILAPRRAPLVRLARGESLCLCQPC
jgi:O-methyltransferase involved in polyketide biosynthesis